MRTSRKFQILMPGACRSVSPIRVRYWCGSRVILRLRLLLMLEWKSGAAQVAHSVVTPYC